MSSEYMVPRLTISYMYHLSNGLEALERSLSRRSEDAAADEQGLSDVQLQNTPNWACAAMNEVFMMDTFDLFRYTMNGKERVDANGGIYNGFH